MLKFVSLGLDKLKKKIYNGNMKTLGEKITEEMVSMKRQGHTLQEIATEFGVSREGARWKIKKYCDKIELPYPSSIGNRAKHLGLLSVGVVTRRFGWSPARLIYYRKQGIISPKRLGNRWFYNEAEIMEIASLLSKCDGYYYRVNPREYRRRCHLRIITL